MKVGIIGTGYVGLPTGLGLVELGHDVVCVDNNEKKVNALNNGEMVIFEEGLDEIFEKALKANKIKFTTSMQEGVEDADVVIIAVGTPEHPVTREADMKYIYAAAEEMAPFLQTYTVVVNKSTVPVGTGDEVEEIIKKKNSAADFDVVSIPEFLREGFAVYDFFNPDRIVIGTNSERAKEVIAKLYEYFKGKTEILYVNRRSSETIKYASNAFLAMKIHYINEMSDFCEKAGADVYEVARGMGLDSRIGDRFLNAGPGYGGGCFPKDTKAMAFMGRKYGSELSLIETTIEKNAQRKRNMAKRVLDVIKGIDKPKVAIWGLAFKGGTDDCRESPAIEVIEPLIEFGLDIKAYDPKAMENARLILGDKISYAANEYEAAKGADVLVVLTEWKDFQKVDMVRIRDEMRNNIIVDLRNLLDEKGAKNLGFIYKSIGRV